MGVRPLAIGVAAMISVAGVAAAFGAGDPGNNSGSVSGQPLNTQEMFTIMTGEFRGDLQRMGPDGKMAKGEASCSNKLEQNGQRLTSCFVSTIDGTSLEGGAVWTSPASGKPSASWTFDNRTCVGTGQIQSREMTFNAQTVGSPTPTKFEQTISVYNKNHFQVAVNRIEPSGQKTLVMHLDMKRMGEGKKSAAAEKFDNSTAVASAKSAIESQKQASVDGH